MPKGHTGYVGSWSQCGKWNVGPRGSWSFRDRRPMPREVRNRTWACGSEAELTWKPRQSSQIFEEHPSWLKWFCVTFVLFALTRGWDHCLTRGWDEGVVPASKCRQKGTNSWPHNMWDVKKNKHLPLDKNAREVASLGERGIYIKTSR